MSGDETLASSGARDSCDAEAWQRAATSIGRGTSLARVTARELPQGSGSAAGGSALRVAGSHPIQRSRQVAFPTVSRGYIPAFENIVRRHLRPSPVRLPRLRRRA